METFQVTEALLQQSQRNMEESTAMARQASIFGANSVIRNIRSIAGSMKQRCRLTFAITDSTNARIMLSTQNGSVLPGASSMLSDRAIRTDRTPFRPRYSQHKHEYSHRDVLRMHDDTTRVKILMESASPDALYVSARQHGQITRISECHGFCYNIPIDVRITTYPVPESDLKAIDNQDTHAIEKPASSLDLQSLQISWSKLCIKTHGIMYYASSVPFRSMHMLKQSMYLLTADSGDVILEGSVVHCKSQYLQFKAVSLTSHVSVVYKDPRSGMLYVLTARKWSKSTRKSQMSKELTDLDSGELIDGVQLHPLEAYLRIKRESGHYFVCRTLKKGRAALNTRDREHIGESLLQWYESHRGAGFPNEAELCRRLKELARARLNEFLTEDGQTLLKRSETFSSAQVAIEALKHAGIMSPAISPAESFFATARHFEVRDMKTVPGLGEQAWSYGALTSLVGSFQTSIYGTAAARHINSFLVTDTGDV